MRIKLKDVHPESMLPRLFIIFLFLGVGIILLIPIIKVIMTEGIILGLLYSLGILIFELLFGGFGLFFLIKLIGPKARYCAVLTHKDSVIHKSKEYLVLDFLIEESDDGVIQNGYKAYCPIKENDIFTVNEKYIIGIQEVNWEIKYVEPFNKTKKTKTKLPNLTMRPILYAVGAIFYLSFISAIVVGIYTLGQSILMGVIYISFGVGSISLFTKYIKRAFEIFKD